MRYFSRAFCHQILLNIVHGMFKSATITSVPLQVLTDRCCASYLPESVRRQRRSVSRMAVGTMSHQLGMWSLLSGIQGHPRRYGYLRPAWET